MGTKAEMGSKAAVDYRQTPCQNDWTYARKVACVLGLVVGARGSRLLRRFDCVHVDPNLAGRGCACCDACCRCGRVGVISTG
jgi:hypothetical protein